MIPPYWLDLLQSSSELASKQAFNLAQALIDHGFHPSAIDPCLYFKKRMIIIKYVDDCIIISNSLKDINTFVKAMKDGPEGYVLTDEGDVNKFLGIETKEITRNKIELSQPF
jgi:hypothetical protein